MKPTTQFALMTMLALGTAAAANAQPWQQPGATTTTRTVTTYTTTAPAPMPMQAPAQAQPPMPAEAWHGRVSQIDQRLNDQQNRLSWLQTNGRISPQRFQRVSDSLLRIRAAEQQYTTQNYGHLTPVQFQQLSKMLNRTNTLLTRV